MVKITTQYDDGTTKEDEVTTDKEKELMIYDYMIYSLEKEAGKKIKRMVLPITKDLQMVLERV